MAAPSSMPKTALKGTISFADGTGTPVTLAVAFTRGDTALGPLSEDLNEPVIIMARGAIIGFTRGAPRPPQLAFSMYLGNVVGSSTSTPGSPMEFILRKGAYASNVSTLGANRKSAVDVVITIEGTNWGDSADETITCEDVVFDGQWAEAMDGNTLSLTGTVLGSVILDTDANTVTLSATG